MNETFNVCKLMSQAVHKNWVTLSLFITVFFKVLRVIIVEIIEHNSIEINLRIFMYIYVYMYMYELYPVVG